MGVRAWDQVGVLTVGSQPMGVRVWDQVGVLTVG
jgi:hypothetical protein